jgi:cation diffusion facilitator family transporter
MSVDSGTATRRPRATLTHFAWLSIAASIVIIALKGYAYWITGSVGLLSDALESVVNLAAACIALLALTIAARPADADHPYGHDKAEYFASGFEGALILTAAGVIIVTAIPRLIAPRPIDEVTLGLTLTLLASLINFAVARLLLRAGRRYDSITLEADAQHLMTDVLTSVAVVIGVAATAVTGWLRLDPLLALAVAARVFVLGVDLLQRSLLGLLDTALPEPLLVEIVRVLEIHRAEGVHYHALRTRQAGARRFVAVHILVPGDWSVQRGHDLLERIEEGIRDAVPNSTVFTHLEPAEDPVSWQDTRLERGTTS